MEKLSQLQLPPILAHCHSKVQGIQAKDTKLTVTANYAISTSTLQGSDLGSSYHRSPLFSAHQLVTGPLGHLCPTVFHVEMLLQVPASTVVTVTNVTIPSLRGCSCSCGSFFLRIILFLTLWSLGTTLSLMSFTGTIVHKRLVTKPTPDICMFLQVLIKFAHTGVGFIASGTLLSCCLLFSFREVLPEMNLETL